MQYCTSCKKSIATIHILDLQEGSIVDQKHLCASCAESKRALTTETARGTHHERGASFKAEYPLDAHGRGAYLQPPV